LPHVIQALPSNVAPSLFVTILAQQQQLSRTGLGWSSSASF
jgi:hypothetical protein